MPKHLGVLNVGAGDIKLSFDKNNMQERLRAARIVKDMLRRGSAILVEVDDGKGGKAYQRVHDFDDEVCEYIIADYAGGNEENGQSGTIETGETSAGKGRGGRRATLRRVPAEKTTGISVARSAGG